jgi:hypothetical protein
MGNKIGRQKNEINNLTKNKINDLIKIQLDNLISLNPDLKNPNLIKGGADCETILDKNKIDQILETMDNFYYPYSYFKINCGEDATNSILNYIISNNCIVRHLYDPDSEDVVYNGTKKQVFLSKEKGHDLKIFKLIFGKIDNIDEILKEPIYMLKNSSICSVPKNITIYTNNTITDILEPYCGEVFNVVREEIKLPWFILTWFEDKAEFDLDHTNNAEILNDYTTFMAETQAKLLEDNMSSEEVGGNVGYFTEPPHFRYIDLMYKK